MTDTTAAAVPALKTNYHCKYPKLFEAVCSVTKVMRDEWRHAEAYTETPDLHNSSLAQQIEKIWDGWRKMELEPYRSFTDEERRQVTTSEVRGAGLLGQALKQCYNRLSKTAVLLDGKPSSPTRMSHYETTGTLENLDRAITKVADELQIIGENAQTHGAAMKNMAAYIRQIPKSYIEKNGHSLAG